MSQDNEPFLYICAPPRLSAPARKAAPPPPRRRRAASEGDLCFSLAFTTLWDQVGMKYEPSSRRPRTSLVSHVASPLRLLTPLFFQTPFVFLFCAAVGARSPPAKKRAISHAGSLLPDKRAGRCLSSPRNEYATFSLQDIKRKLDFGVRDVMGLRRGTQ